MNSLKPWEMKLLESILNHELIIGRGCNDWEFPDYMTEDNRREMIIKCSYYNDNGQEIKENYDGDELAYAKDRSFIQDFEVFFYLKNRIKETRIA